MEKYDPLSVLWKELQHEHSSGSGKVQRRLAADTPHVLYATLALPDLRLGFYLEASVAAAVVFSEESARGIIVTKDWNKTESRVRIILEAADRRLNDLFEVLAGDICAHVLKSESSESGAAVMSARLKRWKRFLQASGESGLSAERQLGLFGELYMLRMMIQESLVSPLNALISWIGPNAESKDFVFGSAAIEVKSTMAALPEFIRVSSEHQLDQASLHQLYLVHAVFSGSPDGGETLPEMVHSISNCLDGDLVGRYNDLLAEAGYLEVDESKYAGIRYMHRFTRAYLVSEQFPKIVPTNLMHGVSAVRYSLELGCISGFEADLEDVKNCIRSGSGELHNDT